MENFIASRRSSVNLSRHRRLLFEALEPRQFLSASPGSDVHVMHPMATLVPDAAAAATPSGFSPATIRKAYGFDKVTFGTVKGDGAGTTIAIVDAYNDPNIVKDLAAFDKQYGLADPPSFKVVNQTGGTKLPKSDKGWAGEIALDVEWAHAMAPAANILLVEANSANDADLYQAVRYAASVAGVVAVSNSWGGSETSTEAADDANFKHDGVVFTVSAGDDGQPAEYPSSSPNVLSIGGTKLKVDSSGNWSSETGWTYGGGGVSKYEARPAYQSALTTSTTKRSTPDVAYDADPNSGVAVYDTYGGSGWSVVGGTSASAPQWAAIVAIADQGRKLAGKAAITDGHDAVYSLASADFHDITSGNNGKAATKGYDLVTGLGTPIVNLVVKDLVAWNASATKTTATTSTPATSTTSVTTGSVGGGLLGWVTTILHEFGFMEQTGGASASEMAAADATAASGAVVTAFDGEATGSVTTVATNANFGACTTTVTTQAGNVVARQVGFDNDSASTRSNGLAVEAQVARMAARAADRVFGQYAPTRAAWNARLAAKA